MVCGNGQYPLHSEKPMAWNPDIYNKFKNERYEPFYDLLALVSLRPGINAIDLGCGTGELTRKLGDQLPASKVLGIDQSAEMLKKSTEFIREGLDFQQSNIESIIHSGTKYDLIFSNAALQWVTNHRSLLPAIIKLLNEKGQLAVQVPSNHHHFTHRALADLAGLDPFREALQSWSREEWVLTTEEYAYILFSLGGSDITVYEKVYVHRLKDAEAVYEWTSGTALLRYLDRLPLHLKEDFKAAYKEVIMNEYGNQAPVFYPFKRIIFSAFF